MNEDRIAGTARNIGGKLEEGVGRVTGDIKEQVQGKLDQAAGAAQDLYGQTAEVARDTAVTFEKWLRSSIETKPYAAVAVALGIGWLMEECIGRYRLGMPRRSPGPDGDSPTLHALAASRLGPSRRHHGDRRCYTRLQLATPEGYGARDRRLRRRAQH